MEMGENLIFFSPHNQGRGHPLPHKGVTEPWRHLQPLSLLPEPTRAGQVRGLGDLCPRQGLQWQEISQNSHCSHFLIVPGGCWWDWTWQWQWRCRCRVPHVAVSNPSGAGCPSGQGKLPSHHRVRLKAERITEFQDILSVRDPQGRWSSAPGPAQHHLLQAGTQPPPSSTEQTTDGFPSQASW